jgi:hypothetical protein
MAGYQRHIALAQGTVHTVRTEPIFVDITDKLFQWITSNAPKEEVTGIINKMEEVVKENADCKSFTASMLPRSYGPFIHTWHNWPKYKEGPVCGYVEYDALFTMQGTHPALLLLGTDQT